MGLGSHGVMRYVQYANDALDGRTTPGAPVRVVKETPETAVVDCGFNFGPVGASARTPRRTGLAGRAEACCHDLSPAWMIRSTRPPPLQGPARSPPSITAGRDHSMRFW